MNHSVCLQVGPLDQGHLNSPLTIQPETLTLIKLSEEQIPAHVVRGMRVGPDGVRIPVIASDLDAPGSMTKEQKEASRALSNWGAVAIIAGLGLALTGWIFWGVGAALGSIPLMAGWISVHQPEDAFCCGPVNYDELALVYIVGGATSGLAVPASIFLVWVHLGSCRSDCAQWVSAPFMGYVAIGTACCALASSVICFAALRHFNYLHRTWKSRGAIRPLS